MTFFVHRKQFYTHFEQRARKISKFLFSLPFGTFRRCVAYVTDAEKKRLRDLENRSESVRGPISGFTLSPLPPKILKIVPEMAGWLKDQNERLKTYHDTLNTTLPPT